MSFLNYLIETSLENIKSDVELSNWMRKNIKYKEFTKLMSANEVMKERKGSCHDQVMFELYWLKKLGYNPKSIFFIEYNDNSGGETHSFVYYNKKDKVCWFENAWGGNEGIKEFASLSDIKNYIRQCHKDGKLGNIKTYPNIEITSFKNHKPGETLQEFVDICTGNRPIAESVDKSVLDKNFKKKTGGNFKYIDIRTNKSIVQKYLSTDKQYNKTYKKHFDSIDGEIVIDVDNNTLAGYVFVIDMFMTPLFVYTKYRGYGLGDVLTKDAVKKYKARRLWVFKDNEVAIKLYKKHGFKVFYEDDEPSILMATEEKYARDVIESLNESDSKKCRIICPFAGTGKNYAINYYRKQGLVVNSIEKLDKFSRQFGTDLDYIKLINKTASKSDILFIPYFLGMEKEILKGRIDYCMIYPDKSLKSFYLRRFKDLEFTDEQIANFRENWDDMIDECESCKNQIRLKKNDYLLDVLEKSIQESTTKQVQLYFISTKENIKSLSPRIPDNFFTRKGYEDNKTPRVCFSTDIGKCLMALSIKCANQKYYVYQPVGEYEVITPTKKQVPDVEITDEKWICEKVEIECIGEILCTGDKGEDGILYTYGPKNEYKAELYEWNWKWVKKYNKEGE